MHALLFPISFSTDQWSVLPSAPHSLLPFFLSVFQAVFYFFSSVCFPNQCDSAVFVSHSVSRFDIHSWVVRSSGNFDVCFKSPANIDITHCPYWFCHQWQQQQPSEQKIPRIQAKKAVFKSWISICMLLSRLSECWTAIEFEWSTVANWWCTSARLATSNSWSAWW